MTGELQVLLDQLKQTAETTREKIDTRVSSFGVTENAAMAFESPLKVQSFEDLENERKEFISKFENYDPAFENRFFYEDIQRAIRKECVYSFQESIEAHIEEMREYRNVITGRLLTAANWSSTGWCCSYLLKELASYLFHCENMALSLKNGDEVDYDKTVILLKSQFLKNSSEYPLKVFLSLLKMFPLIRRKEICANMFDRLVEDFESDQVKYPKYPTTPEELDRDLSRLSGLLSVEYDIATHDGHRFYYLCDDLFSETFRDPLEIPEFKEREIYEKDLEKIISAHCIMSTPVNRVFETLYEQFSTASSEEVTTSVAVYLAKGMEYCQVMQEKMGSWIKLMYVRNRLLVSDIAKIIQKLADVRKELSDDSYDYYTMTMSRIKTSCLAALSSVAPEISDDMNVGRLFEDCAACVYDYFCAKWKEICCLTRIIEQSNDESLKLLVVGVMDDFPAFLGFPGLSYLKLFRLAVDEIELRTNVLNQLTELQKMQEVRLCNDTSWYLFRTDLNLQEVQVPEVMRVYSSYKCILKFLKEVPHIAAEMCDSLSLCRRRTIPYMRMAIWKQLGQEVFTIIGSPLYPYEFLATHYLDGLTKGMSNFFSCRYVMHWMSTVSLIESVDKSNRLAVMKSLCVFQALYWKLKRCMFCLYYLLKRYNMQCREANHDITPVFSELQFALPFSGFDSDESVRDIILSGDHDRMRQLVCAERRFLVMMSVAVRFNNFQFDEEIFGYFKERNLAGNPLFSDMSLYVPIDLSVDRAPLKSLFCNIRSVTDCLNAEKCEDAVIPFAVRIELAQLVALERILISETSINGRVQPDETGKFISQDGVVDIQSCPSTFHCLSLSYDLKVMQNLVKFISTRLRLLHMTRLDTMCLYRCQRAVEALVKNKSSCNDYFSAGLRESLAKNDKLRDLDAIIEGHQLLESYLRKRLRVVCLCLLDDIFLNKDKRTMINYREQKGEQCLKAFWKSLSDADVLIARPRLSLERYVPAIYDHFAFQVSSPFMRSQMDSWYQIHDDCAKRMMWEMEKSPTAFLLEESVETQLLKAYMLKFASISLLSGHSMKTLDIQTCVCDSGSGSEWTDEELRIVTSESRTKKIGANVTTEFAVLREIVNKTRLQLEEWFIRCQMKEFQISSAQTLDVISKAMHAANAMLKPECYSKGKKEERVIQENCIPAPSDCDRQYKQEMHFVLGRIINSVKESEEMSGKNHSGQWVLSLEELKTNLVGLNSLIDFVGLESPQETLRAWIYHIGEAVTRLSEEMDNQHLLNRFVKDLNAGQDSLINYEIASRFIDNYFELNNLRFLERSARHSQKSEETQMTQEIRKDFEKLIAELASDIAKVKHDHVEVYNTYYDTASKLVHAMINGTGEYNKIMLENTEKYKEQKMEWAKRDEEDLRKLIRQMRISRCVEGIGSKDYYSFQISSAAEQKKSLSAGLWIGRSIFKEEQRCTTDSIDNSCDKLINLHIEIEELSRTLLQEQRRTVQQVHAQGMSMKKYEVLLEQEKAMKTVGDVNVQQLLDKLAAAHDELDELVQETEDFEQNVNLMIREPMAKRDKYRRRVFQLAAANSAESARCQEPTTKARVKRYQEDNVLLASNNELLEKQIADLERKISGMETERQATIATLSGIGLRRQSARTGSTGVRQHSIIVKPGGRQTLGTNLTSRALS